MVTAELALAMPVLVSVLALAGYLLLAVVGQLRCTDAAREAARAAARGETGAVVEGVARQLAPRSAEVVVSEQEGWVQVEVSAPVPAPPGLRAITRSWVLRATSAAAVEP